jgi:hypothetical protein
MLSLIEVQCPHCGARGQIMMPPVGAIIIGPCPQCNELVVVFCGHVLPLDKQIMESGNLDERREHLLSVLMEFLQDRIGKLMSEEAEAAAESQGDGESIEESETQETAAVSGAVPAATGAEALSDEQKRHGALSPITQSELERFASIDLKLLDNGAYFKSVFEKQQ